MTNDVEGRIPQDLLDIMATSVERDTDDGRLFHMALEAYERHVGRPGESTYRQRVARLFCGLRGDRSNLMEPEQRRAIGGCAEGLPYEVHDI
jgi:hypothetical protein